MFVFVYGTLMSDGRLNKYMTIYGAELLGEAELKGYEMFKGKHNDFPFIMKGDGVVKGELFNLTHKALDYMDTVEAVPDLYTRTKELVVCDGEQYEASVYVVDKQQSVHKPYQKIIEWINN